MDNFIVSEGVTLQAYIFSKAERQPKNLNTASILFNNIFESLEGSQASAVAIESTFTIFANNEASDIVNFKNNIATQGSTVYGNSANILLRNIKMDNNMGQKGGCLWIITTELDVSNSSLTNNKAIQGGVIFAIQKTFFAVRQSTLSGNLADDGSIVYAMSCTNLRDGRTSKYIELEQDGELVPSLLFQQS